jgi:chromosome segregation ATPase
MDRKMEELRQQNTLAEENKHSLEAKLTVAEGVSKAMQREMEELRQQKTLAEKNERSVKTKLTDVEKSLRTIKGECAQHVRDRDLIVEEKIGLKEYIETLKEKLAEQDSKFNALKVGVMGKCFIAG